MQELMQEEMYEVTGGGTISGQLFKYIVEGARFIFEIGQKVGSAFRRIFNGKSCPIN